MSRHGLSGISQKSEIFLETGGIYIAFILSHVTASQPTTFGDNPSWLYYNKNFYAFFQF
jgi:hypothetical protein